jgi:hypothetical protein
MRPLPLVLALAVTAAATGATARDLPRASAESDASYSCRVQHTPASRACLARCDAELANPAQEDERWACVQTCTTAHLRAVRDCREEAAATARELDRRHAADEDDDASLAFDAGKLSP